MIWDLPNVLVCLSVIFAAYLLGKIKGTHALGLSLISFVPFCLNNVLFNPMYMPDQFTYWHMLHAIRDFDYTPYMYNTRVTEASVMYAFLPLPFVETINSVGFFNKFLLIVVFIWASSVLKLRGWILWFLLLYPSLLLYSSLSLREMLICTVMLLSLWTLMRGWYVLTFICIGLLFEIKMQNALLVTMFSLLYLAKRFTNIQLTYKKTIIFLGVLLVLFYFAFPFLLSKIEYYRVRMYLEDGGVFAEYRPISGFIDFIQKAAFGIFRALFYPLPWACNSKFQLIQSLENIGVALLLICFSWNNYRVIPRQTVFWLFFLFAGLLMYGLVVNNVGTIVRYKLPFVVVYFIFLSYERVRYNQGIVRASSYALNNE
ncbi:MAG: hypothetical protein QM652_07175 [Legionella sp.]|uniref:hypothetical protein n=1 Tax=Legionella sp. TaxID=459 RepID=UPI0039E4E502